MRTGWLGYRACAWAAFATARAARTNNADRSVMAFPLGCFYCAGVVTQRPMSVRHHRQALQPQFADRAAIDRREVRIGHVRLREARQQALDRDGDRGAAENVADA